MASPKFLFYLTCLLLWKVVTHERISPSQQQVSRFESANAGGNVTIRCFYKPEQTTRIYWYKQSLGLKLRLVSSRYVFDQNGTFHNEFKDNPRFTLNNGSGKSHLMITDLHISDTATYFCARRVSSVAYFDEGTVVSVKGSGLNIPALVHQSVSGTIQPGDSVTLTCSVHTGTCDGEHSVYWFRDSGESPPGIIYTHGDSECERKPDAQTHSCFYNLPVKTLNPSHAGTFCAVASCGHMLFGNRTKQDSADETDSLVLVYFLSGSLTVTTFLVVLLASSLFKVRKKISSESQERQTSPSTASAEDVHDAVGLHYAALSINRPYSSKREQSDMSSECVYSRVKL